MINIELTELQAKIFLSIVMQYASEDPRMKTRSAVFLTENKDAVVSNLIDIVNKIVKDNGVVV